MRILISNDDGIDAIGIRVLAQTIARRHEVTVVSPDSERSGASHSMTFATPLRFEKTAFPGGITAYKINGTPADCVKFAFSRIIPEKVDLVISGINRGANLGTDVMYSGTVAAAMESIYLGVPAIAISLVSEDKQTSEEDFLVAAEYLLENLEDLTSHGLPENTMLNINVPLLPKSGIKGGVYTPMGIQEYDDIYVQDGVNLKHYWLRGKPVQHERNPEDCDIEWIKKGYVSITPISYDMTNYAALESIRRNAKNG